jgi:hypothetical protein
MRGCINEEESMQYKLVNRRVTDVDELTEALRATFKTDQAVQLDAADAQAVYGILASRLNKQFNLGIRSKGAGNGRVNLWADALIKRGRRGPYRTTRREERDVF